MMELLRNCSHGSEIATYLVTDASLGKRIVKTAMTQQGFRELNNELEGWKFYQKIRYPNRQVPFGKITTQTDNFMRITIEFIEGFKPKYRQGLEKNDEIISQVVQHYCDIWPYNANNPSPLHGDLSIEGNIIINDEGIHIIDWEHFSLAGAPWGYDVIYLLFETLMLDMKGRLEPTDGQLNIIIKNLKMMKSYQRLPGDILHQPLLFLQRFITDNIALWGQQISKFPVLRFDDSQIAKIDGIISRSL